MILLCKLLNCFWHCLSSTKLPTIVNLRYSTNWVLNILFSILKQNAFIIVLTILVCVICRYNHYICMLRDIVL